MNKQKGFTLIELIVVIVILGILAATAMPKFVDLTTKADQASAEGIAGGIMSSAVVTNAAAKAGVGAYAVADACTGLYLEGGAAAMGTCTTALAGQVCTVSCGAAGSKAVTLP